MVRRVYLLRDVLCVGQAHFDSAILARRKLCRLQPARRNPASRAMDRLQCGPDRARGDGGRTFGLELVLGQTERMHQRSLAPAIPAPAHPREPLAVVLAPAPTLEDGRGTRLRARGWDRKGVGKSGGKGV